MMGGGDIEDSFISSLDNGDRAIQDLREWTLEGKWERVIEIYKKFPQVHTTMIDESFGSVLHVAITLGEEDVVEVFVGAIVSVDQNIEALKMRTIRGDTPLHVAASRGFTKICSYIIGINNERIYLLSQKNKFGETPLFQAVINKRKQAFAYLSHISQHNVPLQDLVRYNGDTILHCAIIREYFDLAIIIVHYYDFLVTYTNKDGSTPLKFLATKPSAFKSGRSNLSLWKRMLYHGILIEPLDVERAMEMKLSSLTKMGQHPDPGEVIFPKNYATLFRFCKLLKAFCYVGIRAFSDAWGKNESDPVIRESEPEIRRRRRRIERDIEILEDGSFPQNYKTIQQSLKFAFIYPLALSGVSDLKNLRKMRKKHQRSGQLLKALMKRPNSVFSQWEQGETSNMNAFSFEEKNESVSGINEIDKKETAFLVAARNGITEMVNEILSRTPIAIHNTNSKNQNVLLVAAKQPQIVETLKMKLSSKPEVWNALILAEDNDDNTMLHLAAQGLGSNDRPWQISGLALHMTWDIKWFQFVKSLVPRHYCFLSNRSRKNAEEIFMETHKELLSESREWLKETSQSCSAVAALVAGACFATASTVPGGNNPEGTPTLEDHPAFRLFAVSSLIGLCFSVTGLIIFLSILISRKQVNDFTKDLPRKLLLGLTSIFVSVIALIVSFCTGHNFMINHSHKSFLLPIYVAIFFPVTFYSVAQFPLYLDLLTAILTEIPYPRDKGNAL